MNTPDRPAHPDRTTHNPFPPTAVARPGDVASLDHNPTIETVAIRSAVEHVTAYIAATNAEQPVRGQGVVLTVVGEYGTGKTHLALCLERQLLRALDNDMIRPMYLDAPAGDMLTLYRERFIPELASLNVDAQVREYYADVVAEELAESALTAPLASRIESRDVTAAQVVQNLGLIESDLQRRVVQRLRAVTHREDFATALSLYQRPEFQHAVWEWFQGAQPDASLIERGIATKIQSEEDALAAIGVFALLFGNQGKRFVVIFDEMEKILSPSSMDGRTERVTQALKRLFEIAQQTNALFVMCGLPDFLEALPSDVRQRISAVLRPGQLTAEDVESYIAAVMGAAFDAPNIEPFNREAVAYLSELAGGNARRVVRLCYLSYGRAVDAGNSITPALIRAVARQQFETAGTDDVRHDVERALARGGWQYEKDFDVKPIKGRARTGVRMDFWLASGDSGAGCAILVSKSVLQDDDVEIAVARTRVLNRGAALPPRLGLLVVNGYLSEALRPKLERHFDRIITRDTGGFTDEIGDALHGLMNQIDLRARAATLTRVSDQLDRVVRQNTALQAALDHFIRHRASPDVYSQAAERGLRRIFGQLAGAQSTEFPPDFARTRAVFDNVLRQLESGAESIQELFLPETTTRRSGRRLVSQIVASPELLSGAACATLLRSVTLSFRRAVVAQLNTIGGHDAQDFIGEIAELCGTMDTIVESPGIRQFSGALEKWSRAVAVRPDERSVLDVIRQMGADVHHSLTRDLDDVTKL